MQILAVIISLEASFFYSLLSEFKCTHTSSYSLIRCSLWTKKRHLYCERDLRDSGVALPA